MNRSGFLAGVLLFGSTLAFVTVETGCGGSGSGKSAATPLDVKLASEHPPGESMPIDGIYSREDASDLHIEGGRVVNPASKNQNFPRNAVSIRNLVQVGPTKYEGEEALMNSPDAVGWTKCTIIAKPDGSLTLKSEPHSHNNYPGKEQVLTRVSVVDAEWYSAQMKADAILPSPKKQAAAAKEAEQKAYDLAVKTNSLDGFKAYLAEFPDGAHRKEVIQRAVTVAKADPQRLVALASLAEIAPDALELVPVEERVLLIGPDGLRVQDVLELLKTGVAEGVVASKIKGARKPYKDFAVDELAMLKKLEVPDVIVEAMLEATSASKAKKESDAASAALRAEIDALRDLIAAQAKAEPTTSGDSPPAQQTVQTKEGPMDMAASCAKRLAALKACSALPMGSSICQATAKSSFPCSLK